MQPQLESTWELVQCVQLLRLLPLVVKPLALVLPAVSLKHPRARCVTAGSTEAVLRKQT